MNNHLIALHEAIMIQDCCRQSPMHDDLSIDDFTCMWNTVTHALEHVEREYEELKDRLYPDSRWTN